MGRVQHNRRPMCGVMGENIQDQHHLQTFYLLGGYLAAVHVPTRRCAYFGRRSLSHAYRLLREGFLQHTGVPKVAGELDNWRNGLTKTRVDKIANSRQRLIVCMHVDMNYYMYNRIINICILISPFSFSNP